MYKNIQRVIWIQEHKRKKREIMQRERHDKFAHRLNDLTLKKQSSKTIKTQSRTIIKNNYQRQSKLNQ